MDTDARNFFLGIKDVGDFVFTVKPHNPNTLLKNVFYAFSTATNNQECGEKVEKIGYTMLFILQNKAWLM